MTLTLFLGSVLALVVLEFAAWVGVWLVCRLTAKRCPACASKWQTELVGEWDGEMWDCHACGHHWETK